MRPFSFFHIRESDRSDRNFGLDLARAIAIVLVLLSHGRAFLPDFRGKILFSNGGFYGVELFFVLSGYLIGGILLKTFARRVHNPFVEVKNFWIRRWFRTIPNYFLFLLLNVTLFQWFFGSRDFSWNYFAFLQNFAWPCPALMPESWSLTVEEWFYLTLPLTFALATVLKNKNRSLCVGLIVYVLFFSALRFLSARVLNPSWDEGIRKVVIYRLDAIGYGVIVAYLNFYHGEKLKKAAKPLFFLALPIIAFTVFLFSYSTLTTRETFFNKTFFFSITSIGLAMTLPYFKEIRTRSLWLRRVICHVSIVSYSMYLAHYSFVIPLVERVVMPVFHWTIAYAVYLGLICVVSTTVYKLYEKPMTDLREKFSRR